MSRTTKFILLIAFAGLQFLALEVFQRYYHRFEHNFQLKNIDKQTQNANQNLTYDSQFECEPLAPPDLSLPYYHYDELGFRTWNVNYNKKCGKRILFLGSNSIGMGYGVSVDQSITAYFTRSFIKQHPELPVEVINVNLPGHPLPKNMQKLKGVFLEKIKPDMVVYGMYLYSTDEFFSKQNGKALVERVFSAEINYTETPSNLNEHAVGPRLKHSKLWYWLGYNSLLMNKLLLYVDQTAAQCLDKLGHYLGWQKPEQVDRVGYLLDLRDYLNQNNIPLVIVDLPRSKNNTLSKEIRFASKQLNIPFYSLRTQRSDSEYTYIEHGHYSAQTNQILGEDIANWLGPIIVENFSQDGPGKDASSS